MHTDVCFGGQLRNRQILAPPLVEGLGFGKGGEMGDAEERAKWKGSGSVSFSEKPPMAKRAKETQGSGIQILN